MNFIEGAVLYVNKPQQWTSFDVVNKTRYMLCRSLRVKKIKVGHAGTLDPLATGVMILCTGKETKNIETYLHKEKEYVATIKLGATTPTFDLESDEDAQFPIEHIDREKVESVLRQLEGDIQQVPPMFSAIRVRGQRAYELARKNCDVALEPRSVHIEKIELLDFALPLIRIRVECSKGTYIRSLARDIGTALQTGAYLTNLQRTRVGDVTLSECVSIEQLQEIIEQEK